MWDERTGSPTGHDITGEPLTLVGLTEWATFPPNRPSNWMTVCHSEVAGALSFQVSTTGRTSPGFIVEANSAPETFTSNACHKVVSFEAVLPFADQCVMRIQHATCD